MIEPTLNMSDAARRPWDIAVVGAGPSGALAARELARSGHRVLSIDRSSFPRWKVCGCCLNGRALTTLEAVGLGDLVERCGAVSLTEMRWSAGGRSASLKLRQGVSLSREAFDAALIEAAIREGVQFLPATEANLIVSDRERRTLALRQKEGEVYIEANLIVAADGLSGRLLQEETHKAPTVEAGSRLGAGAIAEDVPGFFRAGTIFMACAAGGYVGLVRREDGRLTLAAGLDPDFVRRSGGLGPAAASLLAETGWPAICNLKELAWRGTPLLTRSRTKLAANRVVALGDAAGYVEPFTGEGMAWGLSAAAALPSLLQAGTAKWRTSFASEWQGVCRRLVGRRQYVCRALAWTLRQPWLTRSLVRILDWAPALAGPLIHHLNSPALLPQPRSAPS